MPTQLLQGDPGFRDTLPKTSSAPLSIEASDTFASGNSGPIAEPDFDQEIRELAEEQNVPVSSARENPTLFRRQKEMEDDIARRIDAPLLHQWMKTSPDGDLAEGDEEAMAKIEGLSADEPEGSGSNQPQGLSKAEGSFNALGRGLNKALQVRSALKVRRIGTALQDRGKSKEEIRESILPRERARKRRIAANRHLEIAWADYQTEKRFRAAQELDVKALLIEGAEAFAIIKRFQEDSAGKKMSAEAEAFKEKLAAAGDTFQEKINVITENPGLFSAYVFEMGLENSPGIAFSMATLALTKSPVAAGAVAGAWTFVIESNAEAMSFLTGSGHPMETAKDFENILQDRDLMAEANRRGLYRGIILAAFEVIGARVGASTFVKSSKIADESVKVVADSALAAAGAAAADSTGDGFDVGNATAAGAGALLAGAALKSTEALASLANERIASRRAGATATTLKQIGDVANLSKMRKSAPEAFRNAVDFMFRGKPDITISAKAVKTYLDSQGFNNSVVRDWGIAPDIFEAKLMAGGDLVISIADYATDIAGRPFDEFLQKNGRLDADEVSFEEVSRAISNLDGESQKLRMLSQKKDSPRAKRRKASQRIEQDIQNNWRIAESVNVEAIGDTKAVSAFFTSLADRTGADPFDLYVRYRSKSGIGSDLARPAGRAGWLGGTDAPIIEAPDLTSFLARSSDAFLTLLVDVAKKDGPQSLKADVAAIRRLVGSEAGKGISRLHKEKWARGFRAYLLEGKAASPELARAFERQKDWLRELYQGQDLSKVDVSPEIRGMMNRILMSEAEVASARNDARMAPLFEKDRPDGMTGAEATRYDSLANEARTQAETALRAETMETVRRKNTGAYRKERADVRNEVAERVGNLPEYRLLDALGERRDSQRARNRVADLRLDSDQLVEMFGKGILQDLSRE
ncbi:MAG: hypothetical protein AAGE89_08515, partial [Pseudomonadota bacterium]